MFSEIEPHQLVTVTGGLTRVASGGKSSQSDVLTQLMPMITSLIQSSKQNDNGMLKLLVMMFALKGGKPDVALQALAPDAKPAEPAKEEKKA